MKAVLIKGNPRFIRGDEAKAYYQEIIEFMEGLGVDVIEDPGADYTCPPKADFYVAHSRGCGRIRCFEEGSRMDERPNFIMFGDPDGIMHPVDRQWNENGRKGIPPREHFIFTADQKLAIQNKVRELNNTTPAIPLKPRQSASRRPGVR